MQVREERRLELVSLLVVVVVLSPLAAGVALWSCVLTSSSFLPLLRCCLCFVVVASCCLVVALCASCLALPCATTAKNKRKSALLCVRCFVLLATNYYKSGGGRATAGERATADERKNNRASERATAGERRRQPKSARATAAAAGERRRASDGGRATAVGRASERAIGRRRAIDDDGPRTPGRRWQRANEIT